MEFNLGLPSFIKPPERPIKVWLSKKSEVKEYTLDKKLDDLLDGTEMEKDGVKFRTRPNKLFTHRNFFGNPDQRYQIVDLTSKPDADGIYEPSGLENLEDGDLTAEEVDIMMHEPLTAKGLAKAIVGEGKFHLSFKVIIMISILAGIAIYFLMGR